MTTACPRCERVYGPSEIVCPCLPVSTATAEPVIVSSGWTSTDDALLREWEAGR